MVLSVFGDRRLRISESVNEEEQGYPPVGNGNFESACWAYCHPSVLLLPVLRTTTREGCPRYYLIRVSLANIVALFVIRSQLTDHVLKSLHSVRCYCMCRSPITSRLSDRPRRRSSLPRNATARWRVLFVCPYLPISDRSRWIVAVLRILVAALSSVSAL